MKELKYTVPDVDMPKLNINDFVKFKAPILPRFENYVYRPCFKGSKETDDKIIVEIEWNLEPIITYGES